MEFANWSWDYIRQGFVGEGQRVFQNSYVNSLSLNLLNHRFNFLTAVPSLGKPWPRTVCVCLNKKNLSWVYEKSVISVVIFINCGLFAKSRSRIAPRDHLVIYSIKCALCCWCLQWTSVSLPAVRGAHRWSTAQPHLCRALYEAPPFFILRTVLGSCGLA